VTVTASGGVVFRPGEDGTEILLVHRPRYDDWSLPKGKDDPGETADHAAIREVAEETGLTCLILSELGQVGYTTSSGIEKAVTYFLMRPVGLIPWVPNDEVDEVRWLSVPEALSTLSYEHDRALVSSCQLDTHLRSGTFYVVRHGSAGSRLKWEGDDRNRPLKPKGERQAEAIAKWLESEPIDLIVSSDSRRCTETMAPLAARLGLPVRHHPALAEGARDRQVLEFAKGLIGINTVMCSHGDVIPVMLEMMAVRGMKLPSSLKCEKGSTWMISISGGRFANASYAPPVTS